MRPEDFVKYQTRLGKSFSASTARRRTSALRSLLKFLNRQGELKEGVLPSAAVVRLPKRVPKALSLEELDSLLCSPDLGTASGIRDRTFMEIVYGTGLRVSEAVGLRLDELDLDSAAFRVTGKRSKVRWVPIPRHTMPWIELYLKSARPQLVKRPVAEMFLGDRGAKLSRQSAYMLLDKHRRRAGIPKAVSPHTLRHTYAVHLVQGGADLRAVQELLGHASISTTQVYTQLDLAHVRQTYDKSHPRK